MRGRFTIERMIVFIELKVSYVEQGGPKETLLFVINKLVYIHVIILNH